MDPISGILGLLILFALLKRAPDLARDLADAIRNGLDSAAYRDQLRRLRQAGITPSRRGGIARRMLGNAVRQATADLNDRRRTAADALGRQAGRWRQRLDDAAGRAADNIRDRRGEQGSPVQQDPVRATATVDRPSSVESVPDRPALPAAGQGDGLAPKPPASHPATPMPGPVWATATVNPTTVPPPARAIPAADPSRTPVMVTATVDRPGTAPAALASSPALPAAGTATAVLDGEVVTPETAALPTAPTPRAIEGARSNMAVEVTGVVSGAMEAAGIGAAVEMATQEFLARLAAIRQRIAVLMEATLQNVEMQGNGAVMRALVAAAEAAAQAQASASRCAAEVGPLMNIVAAEFNKRNS